MENNHNKFAHLINSLKDPKEYQSMLEAWKLRNLSILFK